MTVSKLDTSEFHVLKLGPASGREVNFATNQYIVVDIEYWTEFERQKLRLGRSAVIDTHAQRVSYLLEKQGPATLTRGHRIVDVVDGEAPYAIMIALGTGIGAQGALAPALWRAELKSGTGKVIERGSWAVREWDTDQTGEARVRWEVDPATRRHTLFGRSKGSDAWKQVASGEEFDLFYGYSDTEDAIYITRVIPGAEAVVRRSLTSLADEELARWTDNSVLPVLDPHTDRFLGTLQTFGAMEVEWHDAELAGVQGVLNKLHPGRVADIWMWSADRSRFVVRVYGMDAAPEWRLYDSKKREISPIGVSYPELQGATLGTHRVIRYKARDGLDIPALVTLPPGSANLKNLPLVVLPHDGPGDYDSYEFSWLAQFLATRGYVVLQPQYRGSEGFTAAFRDAGLKEHAGKIQTDVVDGVAHLVAEGLADPSRVCIAGVGFGGYLALAGATQNPGAYRCAASINGYADLAMQVGKPRANGPSDRRRLGYWQRILGTATDREALAEASPIRKVSEQTSPVLLVASERGAHLAQAKMMRAALQKHGRAVQYDELAGVEAWDETSASRTRTLETLGDFLATHLPVSR